MNATIALLHNVDYPTAGLTSFGRPGNYSSRQIARWTKQYVDDAQAGRDPNMDRLIEWLPENLPSNGQTSVVHGDFRVDNLIFHPDEPRIPAVLDWELSTIGDPLVDFAYHLMMYRLPPLTIAGLLGSDLNALNIPHEKDYVALYCQRTSRSEIPELDFYIAFNMFRLAAIFHGIKGRLIRGTATSAHAGKMADAVPIIADYAWRQAMKN
jgi:aminoglycoside phosphotransferase (APT) family kinase protein